MVIMGFLGFIYFINSLNYEYLSIELLYEISLHSNFFSSSDSYTNFLSVEKLFNNEDSSNPCLLSPGDTVKFKSISKKEFENFKNE